MLKPSFFRIGKSRRNCSSGRCGSRYTCAPNGKIVCPSAPDVDGADDSRAPRMSWVPDRVAPATSCPNVRRVILLFIEWPFTQTGDSLPLENAARLADIRVWSLSKVLRSPQKVMVRPPSATKVWPVTYEQSS